MPSASIEPLVSLDAIDKRFGSVYALRNVTLGLHGGEVHGVIGENGAGKSTLMKILSGLEQPTAGTIRLGGKPVKLRGPHAAGRAGIAMIHQELNLVDDLTMTDNIFLGRERTRAGWVQAAATTAEAKRWLAEVGCDVRPATLVRELSIAQKQMVEIAKAVSMGARVLILDEPTAVLSGRETAALFDLMRRLKAGGVAMVFISHLLSEVLNECDRVTVLRDGQVVETMDAAAARVAGPYGLAAKMVGRPMADHFPPRVPVTPTRQPAFEVRYLSVPGRVSGVSFAVAPGEIVGFAGLIGAGRTEMAEAICGLRRKSSGTVVIDGVTVSIRSPRDAVRAGLAYVSEDRKGTGLTLGMSIVHNTTLASLRQFCRPFVSPKLEEKATRRHVTELSIKASDIGADVASLSGGNQQKVALAKWLQTKPKVLVIDEPTRGVDIGAKEQIYRLIRSLTAQGMACILISSELNEVIGLSDRVMVMRGGRIVTQMPAGEASEEKIMRYAAGLEEAVAV